MKKNLKILTFDGGGSKGIYSFGILSEVEKKLRLNLIDHFLGFLDRDQVYLK